MLYTRKSEIEVIFDDCDTPITVSIWCHLDVGGCVCGAFVRDPNVAKSIFSQSFRKVKSFQTNSIRM